MNNLKLALSQAMQQPISSLAFREVIKQMIDRGSDKTEICKELELLRSEVNENEEDVILEVLDFLHGWCPPDMRV